MIATPLASVYYPGDRVGGGTVLRPSRVLAGLRAGKFVDCMKINSVDPRLIEVVCLAGASAVWLCNEHVLNDWINLEQQIRAAKLHDVDTVVRISKGSYSDFVKPFEADATGIMVPHVADPDEVRQIVLWTRFHPLGRRPIDGGNADGQFCRVPVADYIEHCNREKFIIIQIESPEALENIDAIAAVPGFDILHFGPGDFAHQLGMPGQVNHPTVREAGRRVAAAANKHGKYAMSQPLAPWRELAAEGFQMFSVGADVIGLSNYVEQRLAEFNAELNNNLDV